MRAAQCGPLAKLAATLIGSRCTLQQAYSKVIHVISEALLLESHAREGGVERACLRYGLYSLRPSSSQKFFLQPNPTFDPIYGFHVGSDPIAAKDIDLACSDLADDRGRPGFSICDPPVVRPVCLYLLKVKTKVVSRV